jgi:hypothetical protein
MHPSSSDHPIRSRTGAWGGVGLALSTRHTNAVHARAASSTRTCALRSLNRCVAMRATSSLGVPGHGRHKMSSTRFTSAWENTPSSGAWDLERDGIVLGSGLSAAGGVQSSAPEPCRTPTSHHTRAIGSLTCFPHHVVGTRAGYNGTYVRAL